MQQGKLIEVGTPQALCDHPQEAFTASFLGAPTVVAGHVNNGVFEAPSLGCTDAPAGAKAIILRAERLRLSEAPSGPLQLGGVVASATYLGDDYEVEVETPAGLVRVLTPSDAPPPPMSTACYITALAGGCSFLS
jgi:putative spermidine/putrescine transport system ATP-binding protein